MAETLDDVNDHKQQTKKGLFYRFSSVPVTEKIFFVQHLGVMLRAGISIAQALHTLSLQSRNKKFSYILTDLADRVTQGKSFAESLSLYEHIFGELFVNMIRAGEVSGKYEEVLGQLYTQMKKNHELVSKIRGAMIYPIIVVIAIILVGSGMMIFVIPKLTSIFEETNTALPLPTRILISVSNFFAENSFLIIAATGIVLTVFIVLLKREKIKYYWHTILLVTPIMGKIIKKINIAKFARTLGSLIKTDIPIVESLIITSKVVGSRPYRKALIHASDTIKGGKTIESTLKTYPKLFPPLITQMVLVGEETGTLDEVLRELAEFFEEDVNQTMDNLPSIIEPVLIVLLGIAVGGIAVALIMPLYSLTQAI